MIQRGAEAFVCLGAGAAALFKKRASGETAAELVIAKFSTEIKELYRVHAEQRRDELKPLEDEVQAVSHKVDVLVDRQENIGHRINRLETEGSLTRDIVVRLETAMGNHDERARDTRSDFNQRLETLDNRLRQHIEKA